MTTAHDPKGDSMTKIRSSLIALVVAASATVAATAGAQSNAPDKGQRIERSKSDSMKWKGEGRGNRGQMGPGRSALRGVNPTDAQKAQIKTIHQKYQTQFQSLRTAMKPAMDEAKAARQRGDTAGVRAAFAKTAGTRQQVQDLRARETAEIRAILTPAQQTTFDANVAKAKARGDKARNGKGHGDHGKRRAS
jgi:periplasmic protein CpxP/Spy